MRVGMRTRIEGWSERRRGYGLMMMMTMMGYDISTTIYTPILVSTSSSKRIGQAKFLRMVKTHI